MMILIIVSIIVSLLGNFCYCDNHARPEIQYKQNNRIEFTNLDKNVPSYIKDNRLSIESFANFDIINNLISKGNNNNNNNNVSNKNNNVKCGHPTYNYDYRITDGRPANIGEFPWIISLQRERSFWFGFKAFRHSCGGSIITESWILTAAHCVYNNDSPIRIVAGTDNINYQYKAQLRTTINKIIIHPEFDSVSYDNDIALIKLDIPFDFQSTFSHVAPICLEKDVPILTYDIATVSGFGAAAFKESSQSHLYSTDIAIIDQKDCNAAFDSAITDNMICAGGMIPHKRDACSGDSGGPLQLEVDDHESLIGIVSFGSNCASKYPGVYTRVNNYYDWIIDNIDEQLFDP